MMLSLPRSFCAWLLVALTGCGGPPDPRPDAAPEIDAPGTSWPSALYAEHLAMGPVGDALGDFSYAGYHAGASEPVPPSAILDAADYGAVPDDDVDDTVTLQAAVDAAGAMGGAVVQLEAGVYRVHSTNDTPYLVIRHDRVVLRGAGSEEATGTTLLLGAAQTLGLTHRLGTVPVAREARSYAALAVMGTEDPAGTPEVCLTAPARRGDVTLSVASTASLRAGTMYALVWRDSGDGELGRLLTSPFALTDRTWETRDLAEIDWWARVASVDDATHVTLAQPLRNDAPLSLTPCLHEVFPVREVGIEHLRIASVWPGGFGHHLPFPRDATDPATILRTAREQDYYWTGLWMSYVVDSWVDDVELADVTQGIVVARAKSTTLRDVRVAGLDGHAGITLGASHDVLIERPRILARRTHCITLKNWSSGNVIRDATIGYADWNPTSETGPWLDGHGFGSHENLFEGLDGFYFNPGGDDMVMPHLGRRNVLWNVRTADALDRREGLDGDPLQSFAVPMTSSGTSATAFELFPGTIVVGTWRRSGPLVIAGSSADRDDAWLRIEGLDRPMVEPRSLYEAQLARRLGR